MFTTATEDSTDKGQKMTYGVERTLKIRSGIEQFPVARIRSKIDCQFHKIRAPSLKNRCMR